MSWVSYLGCNFVLPLSDDDSIGKILVGKCFSDAQMRKGVEKHFSTKYVYEVYTNEYIGIVDYRDFQALLEFLDFYLKKEDYCELYLCWFGEENEDRDVELDQSITLNKLEKNTIKICGKALFTIKK